mgnify:FL=1
MVNIRSYEESYNKAINDFIISIYVEEFGFEEHREEIEKYNNEIYKKSDGELWIALNEKNEIVGTIALLKHSDDNVELKKFYVRKDYRGQGVSKALYEKAMDMCKESGFKRIFLGTYERLETAIQFYIKRRI